MYTEGMGVGGGGNGGRLQHFHTQSLSNIIGLPRAEIA